MTTTALTPKKIGHEMLLGAFYAPLFTLVILRLFGFLEWPWLWVLSPFWIITLLAGFLQLVYSCALIVKLLRDK